MVTMSHEEASMKIGDVMCLCKASMLEYTVCSCSVPFTAHYLNLLSGCRMRSVVLIQVTGSNVEFLWPDNTHFPG